MANVEHNVLTDPELHEPKGTAAAGDGQVYVADGTGSGTHKAITPTNCVLIESSNEFPTAVAGVITLANSTTYQIVGSIDIGSDRLVFGTDTALVGTNPLLDSIASTTSGALLTSAASFVISKLSLTCTSGAVFDLNGTGGQTALIDQLTVTSCDTLGDVDAYDLFTMTDCSIVATVTNGFTFTGALGDVRISQGRYTVALGIVFDLQTATADSFFFSDVNIDNASGVTGIDIAASGANINAGGQGYIQNCTFLTAASATAGYVVGDAKWTIQGSVGALRSTALAQGHIVDSALDTTFSGIGGGNDKIVNFGSAFTGDTTRKFTVSTAGRFTYDGDVAVECIVNATAFASCATAPDTYNFYIAKNGTIIASSVSQVLYDGTDAATSVAVSSIVGLVTTDYIELFVRAETTASNLNIDTCSIKIIQASA